MKSDPGCCENYFQISTLNWSPKWLVLSVRSLIRLTHNEIWYQSEFDTAEMLTVLNPKNFNTIKMGISKQMQCFHFENQTPVTKNQTTLYCFSTLFSWHRMWFLLSHIAFLKASSCLACYHTWRIKQIYLYVWSVLYKMLKFKIRLIWHKSMILDHGLLKWTIVEALTMQFVPE